jgi:hypothetical protein
MLGLGVFVNVLDILLSLIIFYLGYKAYRKGAGKLALMISITFLIFCISHVVYITIDIFGMSHLVASFTSAVGWAAFVVIIRIIAYLLLIIGLLRTTKSMDTF